MSGIIFYLGFFMFVTSTVAFIVAILTPFWIVNKSPMYRGIFEACDLGITGSPNQRSCFYLIYPYSEIPQSLSYRQDYAIACLSLSIAAASLGIVFIWIQGLFMCVRNRFAQLRISELNIAGTLLIDCITVVVWVVMLAKNLDSNNAITTAQIGWSLWLAVSSTGGFLIALVLFCIHRIDIGASPYIKSQDTYAESRD